MPRRAAGLHGWVESRIPEPHCHGWRIEGGAICAEPAVSFPGECCEALVLPGGVGADDSQREECGFIENSTSDCAARVLTHSKESIFRDMKLIFYKYESFR